MSDENNNDTNPDQSSAPASPAREGGGRDGGGGNRNRNRGRSGQGRGGREGGGQPREGGGGNREGGRAPQAREGSSNRDGSRDRSSGGGGRPQNSRNFGRHERRPSGSTPRHEAFALFRLAVGVNFLMHGAVRVFGDHAGFVEKTMASFAETGLPPELLKIAVQSLPMIELVFGGLLVLGLFSRVTLAVLALLMTKLIIAGSLKQDWGLVGSQMIYVLCVFFLHFQLEWNKFSLDRLIFGKKGR